MLGWCYLALPTQPTEYVIYHTYITKFYLRLQPFCLSSNLPIIIVHVGNTVGDEVFLIVIGPHCKV